VVVTYAKPLGVPVPTGLLLLLLLLLPPPLLRLRPSALDAVAAA
jgi:hypothetical protein